MPVYTQDSTDLERSFFTHILTICLDIHPTKIAGVSDVRDTTCKHLPISRTVFNLYSLSRNDSSVYELFNTHLLP